MTQNFSQAGLGQNPVVRQLGVMIGIAASVALGIAVVLWSQTPNYTVLFGNLAQKDASEVVAALEQNGIPYKVNSSTGAVMVDSGKVQEARMKLAGQGLPHSDSLGFEILQQETGFGTSRALEAARFHRALEGELARTISTLTNIESARVHLATPKKSVFVRKQNNPTASVVLKLYSGRVLDKGQVAAIVHLVASSVPELDSSKITVVDHKGNLLSGEMDSRQMMLTSSQFEYTKELEKHYRQRVEEILSPILGAERVRAQVSAEVDFTVTEQTSERFNPDLPALRSEQTNEQLSQLSAVQGVPGALSNQPPAAGNAPEVAGAGADVGAAGSPLNSSKRATRNYELDKTISHTRLSSNKLRRLSVAVVVDDLITQAEDGTTTRIERTPEDINRITRLVKESIGFNAQRGDSVEVINSPFMAPEQPAPLPELAIWQQPWVWDVAKQAGGVILVLVLILFVLRPTMKKLIEPPVVHRLSETEGATAGGAAGGAGMSLEGDDDSMMLPGPEKYENTLEAARQMVQDDPKRVAQVIRSWVTDNAG
ncbi:MAG: flagellar basal body M-ring protein FliF [Sedimenticola thiotaurini]|uniref:Flagellar M-ring protein n=1 Tax=Sedimenticola thiotaurini TaxID=1543721 RepID=A0A558D277_9GAMM|nr:MAG: flagellar basal body M-ring protein FliF [Sedimenticola thiotaurini]